MQLSSCNSIEKFSCFNHTANEQTTNCQLERLQVIAIPCAAQYFAISVPTYRAMGIVRSATVSITRRKRVKVRTKRKTVRLQGALREWIVDLVWQVGQYSWPITRQET